MQRLCTQSVWLETFSKAENFAIKLGLNTEFHTRRLRRVFFRVDANLSEGIQSASLIMNKISSASLWKLF